LPGAGEAEREQAEDDHCGIEGHGLDVRRPGLVLGGEYVLVLGHEGNGEQAGVEDAEQDRGRVDQAPASGCLADADLPGEVGDPSVPVGLGDLVQPWVAWDSGSAHR
jgi:hypothetical protein